jgi:hypothetical protein
MLRFFSRGGAGRRSGDRVPGSVPVPAPAFERRVAAVASRPVTPVYGRDPAATVVPTTEGERRAAAVGKVVSDGKFHRASELEALLPGLSWVSALRDACSASGLVVDRAGSRLRVRRPVAGEARRDVSALLLGIDCRPELVRPAETSGGREYEVQVERGVEDELGPGGDSAEGSLFISDPPGDLALPAACLGEVGVIFAKRQSGKTYLAGVMVEEALAGEHVPVCAVDPTGVFWGLCHDAEGEPAAQDVVVLGGRRGVVPLAPGDGGRAAEAFMGVMSGAVVLDVSGMDPVGQHGFVADLADGIYSRLDGRTVHVVVDEADEFAPQRGVGDPDQSRCRAAVDRLIRRGRSRGLGATLVTQRPPALDKNLRSQVDNLWLLCLVDTRDLKAVREWLENKVTPAQRDECLARLPRMRRGDAYFLRGGDDPTFRRFHVRGKLTYDSSNNPGLSRGPAPEKAEPPEALAEVVTKVFGKGKIRG